MKKCPYCAEEIQDEAIVCRYCGRELQTPIVPVQQVQQPTAVKKLGRSFLNRLVYAFGVVIILCFLCIVMNTMQSILNPQQKAKPTETTKVKSSVVISTITAEPTRTPSPTPTQLPTPTLSMGVINEPREVNGIVLTVLNAENMIKMDFLTADPGYIYLVLDITIENIGRSDATPYNPFYFSVRDANGYEYNTSLFAPEPSLKSGELLKGDKVRGFVAFEVKSTSQGMILSYKPLVLLGGYEPIRIALDKMAVRTDQDTPKNNPCESCNFECPNHQGEFEFCLADPQLVVDRNQFERTIKEFCKAKGGDFCKLLVWTDSTYLPEILPLSDVQINNQVADYTKNITTGNDCLKLLAEGNVIYSSDGCK